MGVNNMLPHSGDYNGVSLVVFRDGKGRDWDRQQ